MNYELAKDLKEAGFPQDMPLDFRGGARYYADDSELVKLYGIDILPEKWTKIPILSELIEWCGDRFISLSVYNHNGVKDGLYHAEGWEEEDRYDVVVHRSGKTPEEAVARLDIAIHKK